MARSGEWASFQSPSRRATLNSYRSELCVTMMLGLVTQVIKGGGQQTSVQDQMSNVWGLGATRCVTKPTAILA